MKIPRGMIRIDSDFAKSIGFTSDKFSSDSYLWGFPEQGGIMISLITSSVKGSFKAMIKKIEEYGYSFRIPTPSGRMVEIAIKQGWKKGFDGEICFLTNK